MDLSIISREAIRLKARNAFARGAGRDDHNMNPNAPAVADWQKEWDCCYLATLGIKAMVKRACGVQP